MKSTLVGLFYTLIISTSCTVYQYREPVKASDFYAARLPASNQRPDTVEVTSDELKKYLSKQEAQGKNIHVLSIEPEYFRAHTIDVVSKLKGYFYKLDPEHNIIFINGDLVTLNKVSALANGYGLESFYITKNPKIRSQFLFYVSKVYFLKDNSNFEFDFSPNMKKLALK